MYDRTDFIYHVITKDTKAKWYRIICDVCGEKQGYSPVANKTNYCRNCQYAKLAAAFSQPKVTFECDVCGKAVSRPPSQWRVGQAFHFCGKVCQGIARRKEITECTRSHIRHKMFQNGVEPRYVACGHDHPWNLQAHHKIFVILGGTNELSNLEFLCRNCHADMHAQNGEDKE